MIIAKSLKNVKFSFGPFGSSSQRRWKKPVVSAQTRLETRTLDSRFDKLTTSLHKLNIILKIVQLMSNRKRGPFVSVQLMSRWRNVVGLNVGVGEFIQKYSHIFELFMHPFRKNLCCRVTSTMRHLIYEEEDVVKGAEFESVQRLKKLLMMSRSGSLHVHALRLIRRELGFPEDFRESIITKNSNDFRLVDLEIVELVSRDENLAIAKVEKWREKEYTEKCLSDFETRYAFPINFPTGFRKGRGFRETLSNWQRLPYLKPYDRKEVVKIRTCGGTERFEKRAVGIIHELLNLTIEKKVEVERLAHFRKDFAMEVNIRELLLKHPGIFYISTRRSTPTVFLREAYEKEYLVEPNAIYVVRRKMLELVLLGRRSTRKLPCQEENEERNNNSLVYGENDVCLSSSTKKNAVFTFMKC